MLLGLFIYNFSGSFLSADYNDTLFDHVWLSFTKEKRKKTQICKKYAKNSSQKKLKTFLFMNGFLTSWVSNWLSWKMKSYETKISSVT